MGNPRGRFTLGKMIVAVAIISVALGLVAWRRSANLRQAAFYARCEEGFLKQSIEEAEVADMAQGKSPNGHAILPFPPAVLRNQSAKHAALAAEQGRLKREFEGRWW